MGRFVRAFGRDTDRITDDHVMMLVPAYSNQADEVYHRVVKEAEYDVLWAFIENSASSQYTLFFNTVEDREDFKKKTFWEGISGRTAA